MVNLKKFIPVIIVCMLVTTCNNSMGELAVLEDDNMVLVRFDIAKVSARSVMPNLPEMEDIISFKLYGTVLTNLEQEEVYLATIDGDIREVSVLLRPGKWNFTLEAYDQNDNLILKGVRKGVDIAAEYSLTVHFSLLVNNDSSYNGTALIIIELPNNINVNLVETIFNGVILEPPLEIENSLIEFYSIMSTGDYLIHFLLKDHEGRVIAVITEALVIRGGLESEKTIILTEDDFNNPPASPSNFRITNFSDGNLVFNWEINSWNETGFILTDGTNNFAIDAKLTSYVVVDSNPFGKTFILFAVNDFGESSKLEYKADIPETPIGMTAVALSPNSIEVSWQATNRAVSYIIQRAIDSDGLYIDIGTIIDTEFIDTELSFSTIYYYQVIANNLFGNSPVSNVVSAETLSLFGSQGNPYSLDIDLWSNGDITTEDGIQWFEFIASAGTQYIHGEFGTLNDLYVQLHDKNGHVVGTETRLFGNTRSLSLTLTAGQQYYVRVRPYVTGDSGTYTIGFSTSIVPPAIVLTENVWANGYIIQVIGEQWFTFTATAETQYIHIEFGTLTDV
jgi:hypothetical protein